MTSDLKKRLASLEGVSSEETYEIDLGDGKVLITLSEFRKVLQEIGEAGGDTDPGASTGMSNPQSSSVP